MGEEISPVYSYPNGARLYETLYLPAGSNAFRGPAGHVRLHRSAGTARITEAAIGGAAIHAFRRPSALFSDFREAAHKHYNSYKLDGFLCGGQVGFGTR